jgi:hypothetical protein
VIGGCGRSGTTLMLSVLATHPELHAIGSETGALCPHAYHDVDSSPDRNWALRLDILLRYLSKARVAPTARRVCEKTPRNVHFFERILTRWGERVRLIHMVRDGRDVVTSRHPRRDGYWVSPSRWIVDVEAGWRLEGHPQMLTVRYEDFVGDYERSLRRICQFLQLSFVNAFMDYPNSTPPLDGTAEADAWFGARRKVAPPATQRWRDPAHAEVIQRLLDDPRGRRLLEAYGYS